MRKCCSRKHAIRIIKLPSTQTSATEQNMQHGLFKVPILLILQTILMLGTEIILKSLVNCFEEVIITSIRIYLSTTNNI